MRLEPPAGARVDLGGDRVAAAAVRADQLLQPPAPDPRLEAGGRQAAGLEALGGHRLRSVGTLRHEVEPPQGLRSRAAEGLCEEAQGDVLVVVHVAARRIEIDPRAVVGAELVDQAVVEHLAPHHHAAVEEGVDRRRGRPLDEVDLVVEGHPRRGERDLHLAGAEVEEVREPQVHPRVADVGLVLQRGLDAVGHPPPQAPAKIDPGAADIERGGRLRVAEEHPPVEVEAGADPQ